MVDEDIYNLFREHLQVIPHLLADGGEARVFQFTPNSRMRKIAERWLTSNLYPISNTTAAISTESSAVYEHEVMWHVTVNDSDDFRSRYRVPTAFRVQLSVGK